MERPWKEENFSRGFVIDSVRAMLKFLNEHHITEFNFVVAPSSVGGHSPSVILVYRDSTEK